MRIRIGNYVFGVNWNKSGHGYAGKFMLGHVADTAGITNKIIIPHWRGETPEQALSTFEEKYVFFADYDTSSIEEVVSDIAKMRHKFDMGTIAIFSSSDSNTTRNRHYFTICPSYFKLSEIKQLFAISEHIDPKFTANFFKYQDNTIRLVPKIVGMTGYRIINLFAVDQSPIKSSGREVCFGIVELMHEMFGYFPVQGKLDKTRKTDLTERRYETIRW